MLLVCLSFIIIATFTFITFAHICDMHSYVYVCLQMLKCIYFGLCMIICVYVCLNPKLTMDFFLHHSLFTEVSLNSELASLGWISNQACCEVPLSQSPHFWGYVTPNLSVSCVGVWNPNSASLCMLRLEQLTPRTMFPAPKHVLFLWWEFAFSWSIWLSKNVFLVWFCGSGKVWWLYS